MKEGVVGGKKNTTDEMKQAKAHVSKLTANDPVKSKSYESAAKFINRKGGVVDEFNQKVKRGKGEDTSSTGFCCGLFSCFGKSTHSTTGESSSLLKKN